MKVTFINEMADLCEKVGADVHDVARGIGLDGRIGRKSPSWAWLRRLLFPQGYAGAGAHGAGSRRALAAGRDDGHGERRPQIGDGDAVVAACGGSVRARRSPCSA